MPCPWFSFLLNIRPSLQSTKKVVEELAEELGEEEEEEEQEGDEEGEPVTKALHGQRFPLPNY